MKKIITKIISFILTVNLIMITFSTYTMAGGYQDHFYIEYDGQIYRYTSKVVTLNIDGIEVPSGDMPCIVLDNRTLVPAREVFESQAFNANVDWNGANQEVYISYQDKFIVLKINSTIAYVNNEPITLDVPAKLIRDVNKDYPKTMIPLRFVTETLGFDVEWDGDTYTAIITSENDASGGDTTPGDNGDDVKDDLDNPDEQLEGIGSEKAKRPLPTSLKDNPVSWISAISNPDKEDNDKQIVPGNYPEVSISSVGYREENGKRMFVIKADGPISSLDQFIWDGKYIIDIHKAEYKLDNEFSTYKETYEENPIAIAVRSSQQDNDSNGNKVLRVVYDLRNPSADFNLYLNEDRSEIILEMYEDKMYAVTLGQNAMGDYIELEGANSSEVKAFRLSNPDRIVFDIENTASLLGYQSQDSVMGQYVTSIRTAQFDNDTTRVVVETDGQADYVIEETSNHTTIIQLREPTIDNIEYENDDKPTIIIKDDDTIVLDEIVYEDNYFEREFVIHLPGNYKDMFGEGGLKVNDGIVDSIDITENSDGNTTIIIKTKEVYEFRIEKDGDNIALKAYKPKELYSQIIIVDAGHGGTDPGAVANGAYEKVFNLNIVHNIKELFDADDRVKVYYTRLEDEFISLQERTDLANEVEADFFLSVHNNAYYSSFNGTETIYFKDANRPGLNSSELATICQEFVINAIGTKNRGIKDNNTLFVLRHTEMPAVIVEGGFLTNIGDVTLLQKPETQKAIAVSLYNAVFEVFKQYPTGR